jgi:hypothetical protein
MSIVWYSLDPVNRKIDFYPYYIACKLEDAYSTGENLCVLGASFFNATVHFKYPFYQTTIQQYDRCGFKPPGFRSVRRKVIEGDKTIDVKVSLYHQEWRINDNYGEDLIKMDIPEEVLIDNQRQSTISSWEPEHLNTEDIQDVIVWEWCRGIPEKQGNLYRLSNNWWTPYLYEQNKLIEEAFKSNEDSIIISLPCDNSTREIKFNGTSYASQCDTINKKTRLIRRTIISTHELKNIIRQVDKSIDYDCIVDLLDIPNEYYCCISQCIMQDPVSTVDGFNYDRKNIERWFQVSSKSPLTGLELSSKKLTPNFQLKDQIEKYLIENTN